MTDEEIEKIKELFWEESKKKIKHDIDMYLGAFHNSIQMLKVEILRDQSEYLEYYLEKMIKAATKKKKRKVVPKKKVKKRKKK